MNPRRVFLAQLIDHALVVATCLVLIGVGLLASPHDLLRWATHSALFWIGTLGLLTSLGFFYRWMAWNYFGGTIGFRLQHLALDPDTETHVLVVGFLFESLQPALPAVWLLEFAARIRHSRVPLQYAIDAGFHAPVRGSWR